jgi:hypothetical protein
MDDSLKFFQKLKKLKTFTDHRQKMIKQKPLVNLRKKSRHVKSLQNKSTPSFEDDKNLQVFKELEAKAHQAINSKKVFLVVGSFDVIRLQLINRGWIEKIPDLNGNQLTEKMISESCGCFAKTQIILSHFVSRAPVYFVWASSKYFNEIPINISFPLRNRINRIRSSDFTLKEGLHNLAENIHWNTMEGVSELTYPRSFLLLNVFQREFFLNEFRRTTITSFLFFLNDLQNFDSLFSEDGSVPIEVVLQAIERIEHLIKVKQHFGIDLEKTAESTNVIMAQQIDLVVRGRKKIRYPEFVNSFSIQKLRTKINVAVAEIHVYWPETRYDTCKNIW